MTTETVAAPDQEEQRGPQFLPEVMVRIQEEEIADLMRERDFWRNQCRGLRAETQTYLRLMSQMQNQHAQVPSEAPLEVEVPVETPAEEVPASK